MLRFESLAPITAELGDDARTISGLAVPYGVDASVSSGQTVRFMPGSLPVDGEPPKFIAGHDMTRPLGLVIDRRDTPNGMESSFPWFRSARSRARVWPRSSHRPRPTIPIPKARRSPRRRT